MAGCESGSATGTDGPQVADRPGGLPADPVRELMDQHRTLCEQAVDALEIAAGLEDSGIGPAEAARYRHADVFALAEELYARVPRRPPEPGPPAPGIPWQRRAARALRGSALHVLPCVALLGTRALPTEAGSVAAVGCGAWLVWVAAGRGASARSPGVNPRRIGVRARRAAPGVGSHPASRLGYGLGVGLLLGVPLLVGDPGEVALGLAVAVGMGSVEWSVGWLRHTAHGHLGSVRTLAGFRARMRPALPVALLLHLAVLAVLCFAALAVLTELAPRPGPGGLLHQAALRAVGTQWAGVAALGLLLVPAAVLRRGGRAGPAAAGLLAAGLGSALLTAVRYAPATAQLLCCGAVAALLLPYAAVVLGRPETSAHPGPDPLHPTPDPCPRTRNLPDPHGPGFVEGHPR